MQPNDPVISERLLYSILMLYYSKHYNQAEIAKQLGLSTAKVNRLIKQAREDGLVEITLKMPSQHLFDLELEFQRLGRASEAYIVPTFSEDYETNLQVIGRAAGEYLLQHLQDGDVICISAGKALNAVVEQLEPRRRFDVQVIPATGARQGRYYTDVNSLAARLAEKLGGQALQIHAPVLVDTVEARNTLLEVRQIKDVLEAARNAKIGLFGIGSLTPSIASYFDLMSDALYNAAMQDAFDQSDAIGEILAYVFNRAGEVCMPDLNNLVVGMSLEELKQLPLTIGVAGGKEKALPIVGALYGGWVKALVTDENTARQVLHIMDEQGKGYA